MEIKTITVDGMSVNIPNYFQILKRRPEDPENLVPIGIQTNHAYCIVTLEPISFSESMPLDKNILINGVRQYLRENQGFILAETGKDYSCTIIKSLLKPSGVQYIFTYNKHFDNKVLNIQGSFEEEGMTGIRDSIVYNYYKQNNLIGTENNPLEGWTKDPYDSTITKGALMNISEDEQFDKKFPDFPLSICRDLLRCLNNN